MSEWHASAFTGLFRRFGLTPSEACDPALTIVSGEPATRFGAGDAASSGIGWTRAEAEAACVGEAIERLDAYPLPDDQRLDASFAEWPLAEPATPPERWVLFAPEQHREPGFPYVPFARELSVSWTCCREALTGEPVWAPADCVYLHTRPGEAQRLCAGLSTGLACGRTSDPLTLRGLQEAIERDAVVGAWWGRYGLEACDMGAIFHALGPERARDLTRPNLTYRAYRVVSPWSRYVTIVTLTGEDRVGPCFSVGSACRETALASWEKSLREAVHGRHYVRHLVGEIRAGRLTLNPRPRSFAEHAVWPSLHAEWHSGTPFAHAAAGSDPLAGERETLTSLVAQLGPERPVLVRDLSPPGLVSEGLDWRVVRVVVPGLQPLHGDDRLAHLGGPLWGRPASAWAETPPHPFP